jgi:hypothetical protein
LVAALLSARNAPADTIALFGTGTDSRGRALRGGRMDSHFTILETGKPAVVLSQLWHQWVPDDATSAWIGWVDNPYPGHYGWYTYETTFDLSGYNPATATLSGEWAADQYGHILLNGAETGVSVPNGNWAGPLTPFKISSGFQDGINTLDFVVLMPDGYDGLRVKDMKVKVAAELTSITPSLVAAGHPAFTLTLHGPDFQSGDTILWNGETVNTSFVNDKTIYTNVDASLVSLPGKVRISVAKVGGGTTNARTLTIAYTTIELMGATVSRDTSGNYVVTAQLMNTGFHDANHTIVTSARLNNIRNTNGQQVLGDLVTGSTGTVTLTFPGTAGASGSRVPLEVSGTFTDGTFSGFVTVALP